MPFFAGILNTRKLRVLPEKQSRLLENFPTERIRPGEFVREVAPRWISKDAGKVIGVHLFASETPLLKMDSRVREDDWSSMDHWR
jgi:hypothetical protein